MINLKEKKYAKIRLKQAIDEIKLLKEPQDIERWTRQLINIQVLCDVLNKLKFEGALITINLRKPYIAWNTHTKKIIVEHGSYTSTEKLVNDRINHYIYEWFIKQRKTLFNR